MGFRFYGCWLKFGQIRPGQFRDDGLGLDDAGRVEVRCAQEGIVPIKDGHYAFADKVPVWWVLGFMDGGTQIFFIARLCSSFFRSVSPSFSM